MAQLNWKITEFKQAEPAGQMALLQNRVKSPIYWQWISAPRGPLNQFTSMAPQTSKATLSTSENRSHSGSYPVRGPRASRR